MTDAPRDTAPEKTDALDVPMGRLIGCIVLFGLWSLAVSIVHAALPKNFDTTSVIVAEIAIAPVLIFLFQNLEFGFGEWRVALRPNRIQRAFEKLETLEMRLEEQSSDRTPKGEQTLSDDAREELRALLASQGQAFSQLETADDDVVFIRLRREIERRLRKIAAAYNVPNYERTSASQLLDALIAQGVIGSSEAQGLAELIRAGNAQSHGVPIRAGAAELARTDGDRLLATLDQLAAVPERTMIAEIENLGIRAGKNITAGSINSGEATYFVDLLIPNELVIETRRALRPDRAGATFLRMLRELQLAAGAAGSLVVFENKPSPTTAKHLFEEPDIGVAWREDGHYDGDPTARRLAPWLFL